MTTIGPGTTTPPAAIAAVDPPARSPFALLGRFAVRFRYPIVAAWVMAALLIPRILPSLIARELHDVVAHHVSAIAVQAGVAAAIAERQPERAREALTFIQQTSRQALAEMRTLLTVLRSDEEISAERAPQPSLAQVVQLVGQSRAAGLSVTLEVEGAPRPLPEALDLSAYRIVQEALTNSLKHAGRSQSRVLVRYAPDALELEVSDNGHGAAVARDGAGRGLIGMRERGALFGGERGVADVAGRTISGQLGHVLKDAIEWEYRQSVKHLRGWSPL